jgi:THAP4-like, heme-binding beta-barrel domain
VPVELSPDTPAALVPLAWLIGDWAGAGVVGYPTMERDLQFGQEVSFSHDGRPFLSYASRSWLLDDAGAKVRPLASETGYWRPAGPAENGTALEVLLTHPTGFVETYYGHVAGPRAELATDVVARTATAKEYNSGHRMYGLVEGDLMWVMEMAAVGHPLTAHLSARLKRVS